MSQRIGMLKITTEALKSMLILPDDYEVITAQVEIATNILCLYVSGADIAETEEGAKLPELTPIYHAINPENGKQRIIELVRIAIERPR